MESIFDSYPRLARYEAKAGLSEPPVPRDRLLKPRFKFPPPTRDEVVGAFRVSHLLFEAVYTGGGYWDCPGEYRNAVRSTANRVLGYLQAYRELGTGFYRQRAEEGLEHLLGVLHQHGCFPDFEHSFEGVRGGDAELVESGPSGRALVEGYRLTGDERFLEASRVAAGREIELPPRAGVTVAMAAVGHLAAHYECSHDRSVLGIAAEVVRSSVMPLQLPSGGWCGRDSWMWNHGVIVQGLVALLRALPPEHRLEAELRQCAVAAVNRALRAQVASGEVPPNPRVRVRGYASTHILSALVAARSVFGEAVDGCISGIMRHRLSRGVTESDAHDLADAWRMYVELRRERVSAAKGEPVWRADFSRFVKDVDWGEVTPEVLHCWPPGYEPGPGCMRWSAATSERTGGGAQTVTLRNAPFVGGMGWSIPSGTLVEGRRYRFEASVKCSCGSNVLPVIICSAYPGGQRPEWDPATGCEFTRENPAPDGYATIAVSFVASPNTSRVYVWAIGDSAGSHAPVSVSVDEAVISPVGLPLPAWRPGRTLDRDQDMLLLCALG